MQTGAMAAGKHSGLSVVSCMSFHLPLLSTARPSSFSLQCLNMAALYKLPHIFVVENNKWAIGMDHNRATSCTLGDKSPAIYKKVSQSSLCCAGALAAARYPLCISAVSSTVCAVMLGSGSNHADSTPAMRAWLLKIEMHAVMLLMLPLPTLQGPAFGMPGVLVDGMDVLKVREQQEQHVG
jgi:hypothetical protein